MSHKKRSGIGGFWDSVAPPADEPRPEPVAPDQPDAAKVDPTSARGDEPVRSADTTAVRRPRGRPPSNVPKERMTVNLSSRSIEILESLRYQERMKGKRNATFSDLLDEALELLARHHNLPEVDQSRHNH